jgi:predicted esterase
VSHGHKDTVIPWKIAKKTYAQLKTKGLLNNIDLTVRNERHIMGHEMSYYDLKAIRKFWRKKI